MMDRALLLLLIAGCLMFGAIVFIEFAPAGADDDTATGEIARRPATAPAMRRQQNPKPDELLATILARPLFSNTRRPPQTASSAATDSDLAGTRLTGIVTEPGRRIAVFAVNGAKPLRLGEGEDVSGWRIESITPREVSLSGPSGTKTLEPKIDPSLTPPPGQPPPGNPRARFPVPPASPAAAARSPAPLPGTAVAGQPNPAVPANSPIPPPNPPRLRPQR